MCHATSPHGVIDISRILHARESDMGHFPYHTHELTRLAAPAWEDCAHSTGPSRIPNRVHQPWLHGTQLKWEHLLGMLSVRWVVRPERYTLYYDKRPPQSAQWQCACKHIATECVQAPPPRFVPGMHPVASHGLS